MTGTREGGGDSSDSPRDSTGGVRRGDSRDHAAGGSAKWAGLVPVVYSLVLASIILGPLLGSGYLLLRDAVSTPRSYATDAALGLGDAAPRAVPQDGLLAALSVVVDGGIVVKVIALLALTATGWGAARLARELLGVSLAPQLVAATVAIWNPYVAERLLQGHWSLLTGYAALPWTVLVAQRLRLRCKPFRSNSPRGKDSDGAVGERSTAAVTVQGDTASRTNSTASAPDSATSTPNSTTSGPDLAAREPESTASGQDSTAIAEIPGAANTLAVSVRDSTEVVAAAAAAGEEHGSPNTTRAHQQPMRPAYAWLMLGGVLAAAGLTPTGSLLAGLAAILTVGRRNLPGTIGVWLLSASPWLVATALSGSGTEPSDPAGVAAFAARAEPGLGTLASLAGLGGIWNGDAVPGSRTTLFSVVSTLVLLAVVLSGVYAVGASGNRATRHPRRILLILAAVSIALPGLGATGWGLSAGEYLIGRIPGAGLLRDTQKYVALAMPAFALCAAAGCRALATFRRRGGAEQPSESTGTQPLVAMLFIAALILTLPDLAWGVGGALRPVHYPVAWQRVAAAVEGPGDVAVLPAGMFREFPYSGTVPVLDPAPRMLRSDVLQTGVLPVRGQVVGGEGVRAQRVENLLLRGATPAELAAEGVGWILVEHRTPGTLGDSKTTVGQLEPAYSDTDLTLYRVPGAREIAKASPSDRTLAITAHALWAALLLAGAVAAMARITTRNR